MAEKESEKMEKLVSLCKRRGFIFQSSEIYGGINGFWDYGPAGAELKRNLRDLWWQTMTRDRDDVVGLDATIVLHPKVWAASGHVDTFTDPMVDCKTCKGRFRADQLDDTPCPQKPSKCVAACEGEKTEPRAFNLMFQTHVGPVISDENKAYLRPETAQAIFVQFKNVFESSRVKIPFGICQIGKAFRNEVNPRNYTFRSREFEQLELEFFIRPDEAIEALCGTVRQWEEGADLSQPAEDWGWEMWHRYWTEQRLQFCRDVGLPADSLELYWQKEDELAHYAKATVDIMFRFPFGVQELEGVAARGDYDLRQHQAHSGKPLEVFDEEVKAAFAKWSDDQREALVQRKIAEDADAGDAASGPEAVRAWCERLFKGFYLPHVIEPSAGLDRLALAVLAAAYCEEESTDAKGKTERKTVMRLHPKVAPVKVGIFPLLKNKPELVAKAKEVHNLLRRRLTCFYDEGGSIGRRYARQDEIGTPFGVTIDFDTLGNENPDLADTVTVRERDGGTQHRIPINGLADWLAERIG